jgi:hypothetical protein
MENYNRIEKDYYVTYYYLNNKLHRIDGPAEIWVTGTKEWWQNGKLHRDDGPAVEYSNGIKAWYQNGLRHRLDGPAIELSDGYKEWWIEGKPIKCSSQEEFERYIKLKLFW